MLLLLLFVINNGELLLVLVTVNEWNVSPVGVVLEYGWWECNEAEDRWVGWWNWCWAIWWTEWIDVGVVVVDGCGGVGGGNVCLISVDFDPIKGDGPGKR